METFFSVYQPLVSLQERRIAGYVSLLRARQNGTVIGADEMFPVSRPLHLQHLLNEAGQRCALSGGWNSCAPGMRYSLNILPARPSARNCA